MTLHRRCRDICVMDAPQHNNNNNNNLSPIPPHSATSSSGNNIDNDDDLLMMNKKGSNNNQSTTTIHRFLVGTSEPPLKTTATDSNGIFICEYDDENNTCSLATGSPFPHESGEIWSLSPRPVLNADDSRSVLSCFATKSHFSSSSSLPGTITTPTSSMFTPTRGMTLTTIQGSRSSVAQAQIDGSEGAWSVAWNKTGLRAVSSHQDGGIRLWTTTDGEHITLETKSITSTQGMEARDVVWDPLSPSDSLIAYTCGTSILGLDLRNPGEFAFEISIPGCINKSVDINPNRPHTLVCGGEDGALRFWDTRKPSQPVQLLSKGGHSHFITKVRYNPFHDQLVLSSSTDGSVCLWRAASISSAPLSADLDFTEDIDMLTNVRNTSHLEETTISAQEYGLALRTSVEDGLIQSYTDSKHDSVYGIAWSSIDAWTFVSLSYHEGGFIVRNVPSAEKYKILL
jgi:WD40 repeat protein